jgi:hypothetical protein
MSRYRLALWEALYHAFEGPFSRNQRRRRDADADADRWWNADQLDPDTRDPALHDWPDDDPDDGGTRVPARR